MKLFGPTSLRSSETRQFLRKLLWSSKRPFGIKYSAQMNCIFLSPVAMNPRQMLAMVVFLASSFKCQGKTAVQCPSGQPIYGKALQGYTFKTLVTPSSFGCLVDCHYEDRCQSYNYVIKTNICEMNNRTKEAKPDQFVSDPDRFYMKRGAHRSKVIVTRNSN